MFFLDESLLDSGKFFAQFGVLGDLSIDTAGEIADALRPSQTQSSCSRITSPFGIYHGAEVFGVKGLVESISKPEPYALASGVGRWTPE